MGETVKRNEIRLTRDFLLSEFEDRSTGLVRLHPLLPARLQQLRFVLGSPLVITSSCRTWAEHVRIYRQIYGDKWEEEISLASRHLITNPSVATLPQASVLARRLNEVGWNGEETYRTCSAADIRCPEGYSVEEFADAARQYFDFVRPYPWGVHVDLRYSALEE